MTIWKKEEIKLLDGRTVAAQMSVIVSASRSTDTIYSPKMKQTTKGENK